ncbi:MAG: LysE family transporter [Anaerolineae bacterium]|nr:LysE family transporter [Anaerolineae bacterium]MBN8619124.1 LysE family transporter [Anaerolineae bacterium]
MFELVSQGVSIAFAAGSIPGPFTTFLITKTLSQGWRKTIVAIFAPLISDIPIIFLSVVVLRQFPPEIIRFIQFAGGVFLLWLAYGIWKQFRAGGTFQTNDPNPRKTLSQALVMNWLSPGPYIFWATINGPLLVQGLNQSVWAGAAFLAAFYGTFLGILGAYVIIFDRLGRIDARITRAIFMVTLVIMVVFALRLIGEATGILGAS